MSLLGSRAVAPAWRAPITLGILHPPLPARTLLLELRVNQTRFPALLPCCRSTAIPTLIPVPGMCGFLGAEQLFWRLPDNSALYLPPVPPNTLVSAAALCCKFPWSNYVLIYDNPGRAVEGGKRQSSLEVARRVRGPPWLLLTLNSAAGRELLRWV